MKRFLAEDGATAPVAVVDVNVVPMDIARIVPAQAVVIDRGRVVAMGPAESVEVAGIEVVDGRDLYLTPGLADMHVHLWGLGEDTLHLANGITTVRNMWGDPVHLAWQRQVDAGTRLGPRIITTTPAFGTVSPSGESPGKGANPALPEDAAWLVADLARRGYQQVKVYSWLEAPLLAAVSVAAKEHGLRLVGHCPETMTMEDAVAAGQTCFEHLNNLEVGHSDPVTGELDLAAVARLGALFAEQQIWNCPTLVSYGRSPADTNEGLEYLRPGVWWHWKRLVGGADEKAPDEQDAALRSKVLATRARRAEIVGLLRQQGAPLLAGTDCPNPYVVPGFALHEELGHLVTAGLSPYDAIRCATAEAARFMGEDDWGVVRPGARADLVLVRRNPLADVGALREIEAVFLRGRHLPRSELDALLEQETRFGPVQD